MAACGARASRQRCPCNAARGGKLFDCQHWGERVADLAKTARKSEPRLEAKIKATSLICDIENGVPMPVALPQEEFMPERRFKVIKLKKPAGPAPTFPSEIRTIQAAIAFMKSLEPKTRAKLHWRLAASALAALDTGPIREGTYDRANKAMRHALAAERWLSN